MSRDVKPRNEFDFQLRKGLSSSGDCDSSLA